MRDLLGQAVLVTGAAGFIGTRLVEQLAEAQAEVKALVRSGVQLGRFERLGCRPVRGDVTMPESLVPAVKGCEIIFHCAVGGGDLDESRRVNVQGTSNLLEAAAEAGVRRAVCVSSIAVHGTQLPDIVSENQPYITRGSPYEISKAEAERTALEFGQKNKMEVVIIRPTLVYGPCSKLWTLSLVNRIKYEKIVLVGGGRGVANMVYVDDVVQAMILGAIMPGAIGETFFITGGDRVTWRDLVGRYAQMLGKPLPPSIPRWKAKYIYEKELWRYRLAQKPRRIEQFDLHAHVQSAIFSIEKAQRLLRFIPEFSFDKGMAATEKWLRQMGYLLPVGI